MGEREWNAVICERGKEARNGERESGGAAAGPALPSAAPVDHAMVPIWIACCSTRRIYLAMLR